MAPRSPDDPGVADPRADAARGSEAVGAEVTLRAKFAVVMCVGLLVGVVLSEARQYVAFRLAPGRVIVHCLDLHGGALF